ncbi:hypothetical protein B0T12DRAFT_182227 [Alternaria alternata]|nr:hypothetical protein B0T12DRAFT_182227 [Alternaria alternata]
MSSWATGSESLITLYNVISSLMKGLQVPHSDVVPHTRGRQNRYRDTMPCLEAYINF